MDSMKSLNTSLPRSFPRRHPTADLHQAFKAAALSVAQLYKTAAADEDNARAAGYQDAVEDLLAFLDQENLGVGDGEGWRIRQWATERMSPAAYGSDREDEVDEIRPARSDSPTLRRRIEANTTPKPAAESTAPSQVSHASLLTSQYTPPPSQDHEPTTRPEMFQFRSSVPTLDDMDMINSDRSMSLPAERSSTDSPSRPHRNHANRHNLRARASATALAALGLGAGGKRRSPFSDIFDITSLDNNRDGGSGGGGGKRGRHV